MAELGTDFYGNKLNVPCAEDLFLPRFVACGDLFRDRSPQQRLLSKISGLAL